MGIFHNSGIALFINKFSNCADILNLGYTEKTERITDVENVNLQCNHAVAGYFVGKSQKLPKYICESLADHHKVDTIFSNHQLPCEIEKNCW